MAIIYSDESKMLFGEHKGKKLANVPASYLLFIYRQDWFIKTSPLGIYINNNMDVLKSESKK